MGTTSTVLIISLAWSLPFAHFFVRRASNPVYWEEGVMLFGAALFATCFFPPSYMYVTQIVSPGTVYIVSTLTLVILAVLFCRYLKLYNIETMVHVPGLDAIRRWVTISGIAVFIIVSAALLLSYDVINYQALRPLSVEIRDPFILISQVLLYLYFVCVLWVGLNYPLLYIIRVQGSDPAFYTQGKPLRFGISIVLHLAMSVNLFALLVGAIASFMLPVWAQGDEVVSLVSTWCSPIIIVLALLTRAPQEMLAGMYTWYLCLRLAPLHAQIQQLHPGNALYLDRPSLLHAVRHVEHAKVAVRRMVSDITDARLVLYSNAGYCRVHQGVTSSKVYPRKVLRKVAVQESAFLAALVRKCPESSCLPLAARSVECQSLLYYRLLARAVARQVGTWKG